jgi:hypothetical protein
VPPAPPPRPWPPCSHRETFFSSCAGARAYSGVATFVRAAKALPFEAEAGFSGCLGGGTPHESLAAENWPADELKVRSCPRKQATTADARITRACCPPPIP